MKCGYLFFCVLIGVLVSMLFAEEIPSNVDALLEVDSQSQDLEGSQRIPRAYGYGYGGRGFGYGYGGYRGGYGGYRGGYGYGGYRGFGGYGGGFGGYRRYGYGFYG